MHLNVTCVILAYVVISETDMLYDASSTSKEQNTRAGRRNHSKCIFPLMPESVS